MERFMNKALALGFALLMPFGFTYADKQPKPNKKQRQQDIQRFIQLANNPDRSNALAPVLTGNDCFDYCMEAYHRKDAQYARDTIAIKEAYRQNEWLIDMSRSLTEKEMKKYQLNNIGEVIAKAEMEIYTTQERYKALTKFCNRIITMRHKAEVQNMPTGKVKHFLYEETGSSRPDPVLYEIKVDSVTGTPTLYGPQRGRFYDELGQITVALQPEVLDTLREKIESEKIYQELSAYSRPHIPDVPEITGGPPSWRFSCEFESGKIDTSGTQFSPPRGCTDIAYYLNEFLEQETRRRIDQSNNP